MTLSLDSARTRIRIHTFAEGLLSRLAHDLELHCRDATGTATDLGNESGSAQISIPISKIEVAGTLKNGVVDPNGLSASDRADCLGKMRREVFQAKTPGDAVRVEAELDGGRARVRLISPNGKTVERSIAIVPVRDGESVLVSGTTDVSLTALGSWPVKGPMNAFRVKDRVELLFELAFVGDQPA